MDNRPKISPLAKRLAEENGIDYTQIKGTGPEGRIVERDVLTFLTKMMAEEQAAEAAESQTGRGEAKATLTDRESAAQSAPPQPPPQPPPPADLPEDDAEDWPEIDMAALQAALDKEGVDLADVIPSLAEPGPSGGPGDFDVPSETPPTPRAPAEESTLDFGLLADDETSFAEPRVAREEAEWAGPAGVDIPDQGPEPVEPVSPAFEVGEPPPAPEPEPPAPHRERPSPAPPSPPPSGAVPPRPPEPPHAPPSEAPPPPAPPEIEGIPPGSPPVASPQLAEIRDLAEELKRERERELRTRHAAGDHVVMRARTDLSELQRARSGLARKLGGIVPASAFLVRAAAIAIHEAPLGESTAVGIAVSGTEGLVTPLVGNAAERPLAEVLRRIGDVADRARAGLLGTAELGQAGLVVLDLSESEVDDAEVALANVPAVLTLGRITTDAYATDLASGTLTLSARVLPGPGARFLRRVQELLKSPYELIV
jgi:pyruvate/2-oxoglutarate dehydrogenase complex dihydrolipoamide acyltransferase (E2) component